MFSEPLRAHPKPFIKPKQRSVGLLLVAILRLRGGLPNVSIRTYFIIIRGTAPGGGRGCFGASLMLEPQRESELTLTLTLTHSPKVAGAGCFGASLMLEPQRVAN